MVVRLWKTHAGQYIFIQLDDAPIAAATTAITVTTVIAATADTAVIVIITYALLPSPCYAHLLCIPASPCIEREGSGNGKCALRACTLVLSLKERRARCRVIRLIVPLICYYPSILAPCMSFGAPALPRL